MAADITGDQALLNRILIALRRAFDPGPRLTAMDQQITRWFVHSWRSENSSDPHCGFCNLPIRRRYARAQVRICGECLLFAARIAGDTQYPVRDMVRSDALRALGAIGDEESARRLDLLAASYPDLQRVDRKCDGCGKGGKGELGVAGVRWALCVDCLGALYQSHRGEFGE